ncbi:MAG: hypothetical protein L6R37_006192 [Teloschistes peruensis]|nr:MAG: hypothetical protein L6R37_006192 [Teloschistes peruensis]
MFREPEEVELKPVTKVDPTASERSSIRRHRSVRYPPYLNRDRYLLSRSRSRRRPETPVEANRALEEFGFRTVGARSYAEHAYDIERSANYAHAEASRQRRHESGRAMLRDALSYERAHRSIDLRREHSYALSMMRPPTPPTSLSRNPSRLQRQIPPDTHGRLERRNSRHRTALSRTPPPAYIPSPPYTSGEQSDRSSPDGQRPAQGTASLTPHFAPAHPLRAWESPAGQALPQIEPPPHDDVTAADSTDSLPLRRVSRRHDVSRSYQGFPHSVVDGLGDRWRSVSPDDAFWENLVSTMPPDARLPSTSASSSFRSNEASSHYDTVDSRRAIAESIDSYPYVCENTDSEFSEVEEDAVRTLQRLGGGESYSRAPRDSVEDSAATWQRRMHAPNTLSSQSAHQRRALSNGGGTDLNNVLSTRSQRQQTDEWFQHNQRRELGRPSRERL